MRGQKPINTVIISTYPPPPTGACCQYKKNLSRSCKENNGAVGCRRHPPRELRGPWSKASSGQDTRKNLSTRTPHAQPPPPPRSPSLRPSLNCVPSSAVLHGARVDPVHGGARCYQDRSGREGSGGERLCVFAFGRPAFLLFLFLLLSCSDVSF